MEKNAPSATYHAVDEEGVSLRDIAEAIGKGLRIPVVSLSEEEASGHFGPIAPFVSMNLQGSSKLTQKSLDWKPTGPGMIEDLSNMDYGI